MVANCQAEDDAERRYYAMHPGWVDTPGVQTSMPRFRQTLAAVLRTPYQGIDTALWLASERPKPATDRIWFDRRARAQHVFRHTRRAGDDNRQLKRFLDRRLEQLADKPTMNA